MSFTDTDFGYYPQPEFTAEYCDTLESQRQDVGIILDEDTNEDVLLYRPLVSLIKQAGLTNWLTTDNTLKSYNQGNIGSCVGNGAAIVNSVSLAGDVAEGQPQSFSYLCSAEACYGTAREAGGLLGARFDGASGSGSAKGDTTLGTLWQTTYGSVDLTTYSVSRCKQYGTTGIPKELKTEAETHKVNTAYLVKDANELWSIIGAGHPISVCSSVGFASMHRDAEGVIKQSGSWNHCMAAIGRRTTSAGNRLILIINSWGDNWAKGGLFADQPPGSFYADIAVVDKMVKQGDTFCRIGENGIWRRRIDWENW